MGGVGKKLGAGGEEGELGLVCNNNNNNFLKNVDIEGLDRLLNG